MAAPPPPQPRLVASSLIDYLAAEIVAYYAGQDMVPPGAALDAIGASTFLFFSPDGPSTSCQPRPSSTKAHSPSCRPPVINDAQASASATSLLSGTRPAAPAWVTRWTW